MNFKRNILGLAVVATISGISAQALAEQVDAPLALADVEATAPVIVAGAGSIQSFTIFTSLDTLNGNVNTAKTNSDLAVKALNDKQAAISEAQGFITAANALSAGELINGATKAEILAVNNQALGSIADATSLLGALAGLESTVASTASALADAQALLDVRAAGTISADILAALQQQTLESAQITDLGAVTDTTGDTLGQAVLDAKTALGDVTDAADATGSLYAKKAFADGAVTTAATASTTNGADTVNTALTVTGQAGTASTTSFTVTSGDNLDIRDVDSQITMTIGTTAGVDDADALVAAINADANLAVTAENAAGTITLTYDDAASATKVDAAGNVNRVVAFTVDGNGVLTSASTDTAGNVFEAASTTTYGVALANAQLAATEAATAVSLGAAQVTSAETAFTNAGLVLDTYTQLKNTALTSASSKMATATSVISEELTVEQATEAGLEKIAVASETISATDAAASSDAAAAVVSAQATKDAAQTTYDDAVALYIATAATPEGAANQTAMTEAQTALANANTALNSATSAAAAAASTAAGSLATANSDRGDVVTQQNVVAAVAASLDLQTQIAADANNPAASLQAELVKANTDPSKDSGGAMVAAVNSNFQSTSTNAAGIAANVATLAVHEGLVTTNIANIATNTTNIATNTTNIATNTAGIATNTAGIATNTAGLASNAANLQRVELQMNENVDMLKSGIASALAIAGMPTAPGEGMGFSVGTGYFDGESAVAMGLTFVDGSRSYKLSLGHSGGETSASAGAAFKF
ncbi:YadA C-terminal domain-containing protein [SAR92 clade bacterium H921]|nr:YadA C-terminal domain-containing protein [SAR92 clade bacterium H921]